MPRTPSVAQPAETLRVGAWNIEHLGENPKARRGPGYNVRQTPEDIATALRLMVGGGRLSAPDNVTPRYRGELMRLMAIFVDSEMAGASGFADCINLAPGLKERITATRIVFQVPCRAERPSRKGR